MSMLAGLVRAYERLPKDRLPAFGYAVQEIQAFVVLNRDGDITALPQPWGHDEKGRLVSRAMMVPYFGGRSGSAAPPYFLWDNTAYVFGVSGKDGFDASKRFDAFLDFHVEALIGATTQVLVSVRKFLLKWSKADHRSFKLEKELLDRNVVFRLNTDYTLAHECDEAKEIWESLYVPDTVGERVCLITGTREMIARLHPPIKGFENPARIVSFDKDNDAFSSYGHVQAENAPVGVASAFKYTAVLNNYLARASGHRLQVGDASTVFWADAANAAFVKEAEALFGVLLGVEGAREDAAEASRVKERLAAIRDGRPLAEVEPALSEGVRFFVLGLAPNAARLAVRFYVEDTLGRITGNYQRFLADMRVQPAAAGQPGLWRYLIELAVQGKRENVPPTVAGAWMRAILEGTPYPLTLLSTALMRIRSDSVVNGLRAGILRAVLVRNRKMEVPVALDPNNRNKGYLLGRLFAVYEEIQRAALGKVNASIRDKFYGAASASPQKVFALLDRGSASHLGKIRKEKPGYEVALRRDLAGIMEMMEPDGTPYPASLSAEEQALFGLGYYHQSFTPRAKGDAPAEIGETA
jgi:CRISPR-associated protein Csd1